MANLFPPRQQSLAASAQIAPSPGSFNTDLRSVISRADTARSEYIGANYDDDNAQAASKRRQAELRSEIEKETKIKIGTENMLEALNSKKVSKEQRYKVEAEHNSSKRKIDELQQKLYAELKHGSELQQQSEGRRMSFLSRSQSGRPPSGSTILQVAGLDPEEEEEDSPTFVLSELLQALEEDGMGPEYYIDIANRLVNLLKRHPTLKYDLAWSIFGLRIQTMLLSDSREVVAAGYRVVRHAITDRRSLKIIRDLHTDYLVILSLVKDSKASVEREQALKFARAFLDVTDGVKELSIGVIRTIVAVAEHSDDRLRNIATLTLAEILIKDPGRLVEAGGMGSLATALGDPTYRAAQSLTTAFLYLLDVPSRRRFLRSGYELEMPIASFTESPIGHITEEKLKTSSKVIAALLRSWPGLLMLASSNFLSIRSLVASLRIPLAHVRGCLLELLIDVLRIKPPSWSSSFLAGRRLTTYARVTNLKATIPGAGIEDGETEGETNRDLVEHFVAIVLAVFLQSGLIDALLFAETEPLSIVLKRKTTLVLGEVLKLSSELLPTEWSAKLQVLPDLWRTAARFETKQAFSDNRFIALGTIYQVDSVNRTLYRSDANQANDHRQLGNNEADAARQAEQSKVQQGMLMDEAAFRTMMIDSGVIASAKYNKWRWDIIQNIIDGPLKNPKRLEEAAKSTKFLKHLLGFYRPFKWRFCEVKNTKPNQRYVRMGAALMGALLKSPEGERELKEGKLIRQLAECLSHYDRMSGLLSEQPLFTEERLNETLTGGYFQLLGALSKDPKGLQILERWRFFNMFYHIVELEDRDDLIRILVSSMDYTLHSHLRIILSKAMTSCSKDIRIFSTRLLRRYATKPMNENSENAVSGVVEWAIRLLITQLYDPEIEVGDVAIKILQEACAQKSSLEYIVQCRPALDHLGPIGAPLLLRFLSTSVGYKYLQELDYITREMDDWFLGRNDDYVSQIEASLARALSDLPPLTSQAQQSALAFAYDDPSSDRDQEYGVVPPHFYRELTRTKEGAALLTEKGHFEDFVEIINDHAISTGQEPEPEAVLKIKGCLWAVGNVGSMELGAPFLEESNVVQSIVEIAENSCVLSVRGTAFFALGLISRSLHGQEILLQCGWDGMTNFRGEGLGYAIPLDMSKLFSLPPVKHDQFTSPAVLTAVTSNVRREIVNRSNRADSSSSKRKGSLLSNVQSVDDEDDPITARILKLVTDLGNTVLTKKAAGDLNV